MLNLREIYLFFKLCYQRIDQLLHQIKLLKKKNKHEITICLSSIETKQYIV